MDDYGRTLALVIAPLLFYIGVKIHRWYMARQTEDSSPTSPAPSPPQGVTYQLNGQVTPDDPTSRDAAGEESTIMVRRSGRAAAMDSWIAEQPPHVRTTSLIRQATERFSVSASTVKRALRRRRGNDAS